MLTIGEFRNGEDPTILSLGQWQLWKAFRLSPYLQGVLCVG
jgi:hypothetical protein